MNENPTEIKDKCWPPPEEGELFYRDEGSFLLPGWPGYRNRSGLSGLDPLHTDFELAHMEGVFLRALFSGKLTTDEPLYLLLMGFLAGFCTLLFAMPIIESLAGGDVPLVVWFYAALPGSLGGLLIWNIWRGLKEP